MIRAAPRAGAKVRSYPTSLSLSLSSGWRYEVERAPCYFYVLIVVVV